MAAPMPRFAPDTITTRPSVSVGFTIAPGGSLLRLLIIVGDCATGERYAIAGAPSEIPEQVREVTALGFTSASLNLAAVLRPTAAEGYVETIDGFASVIDDCR